MSIDHHILLPTLGTLLGGWLCLSGFVLVARAVHDLNRRSVEDASGAPLPPWYRGLSRLSRRRPSAAYLIAADAAAPDTHAVREAARVEASGHRERLLQAASAHRGDLGRWRRVAALRILARADDPEALPLLERALYEGDAALAGAAVDVVGSIGSREAVELLLRVLREDVYSPSRVASHLDRPAVPIDDLLRPLLDDPSPTVRFWATTLLARYGQRRGIGIAVASHAADADANVRAAVAESLGSARRSRARDTAIRELLADPVWYVRVHAARSAGSIGLADEAGTLAGMLADREWWVRSAAKDALAALGTAGHPALLEALDHPDRFARNGAAEVLLSDGYLDELVASIVEAPVPRPEESALLRRIVEAGEPELRRSVLAQAGADHRQSLERLLGDDAAFAEAA